MESASDTLSALEITLKDILPDGKLSGKLPPVHLWHPERIVTAEFEIRANGSWWHNGGEIKRERLVRLFSTILRKEPDGQYVIVTPYEKAFVSVVDAPFMAIRLERIDGENGQNLGFLTNVGDLVVAAPSHPLRVVTDPQTGEPSPYVMVRDGLEAKLTRPVFYELAEFVETIAGDDQGYGVWSDGAFFRLD